jgi:hypothetical protein
MKIIIKLDKNNLCSYYLLLIAIVVAPIIPTSNLLAQYYSNKDTVVINNKLNKNYVLLPTANHEIHLLMPNKHFNADTVSSDFLGLVSKKYNTHLRISFSVDNVSKTINGITKAYQILKYDVLKINDAIVQLVKYKTSESSITWSAYCESDFFTFFMNVTYDKKFDKELSKNIEKTYRSLIVTRNPDITPSSSIHAEVNTALLDLKFVQKMFIPLCYFTEDGIPLKKSKGTKYVIVATPSVSAFDTTEISDAAIQIGNNMLKQNFPEESIIPEKVYEANIAGNDGICIEGTLASNPHKSFMMYFSKARIISYATIAVCNEEDKVVFFNMFSKFKESIKPVISQ